MDMTTKSSRVFIIQADENKNLLGATEFGVLQDPVFDASKVVMFNSSAVVRELKSALSDFNDHDYILAVGDWVLVGVACSVAAKMNGGRYNVLKWDRETRQYYSVPVDLNL